MNKKILKMIFSALTVLISVCAAASAATVDGMAGFATQNGGTTGGAGGEVVTVTNLADFMTAVRDADPTPRTVYINVPELNSGDDKGKQVKLGNNKTIIGCGSGTFMNGVLLGINGKTNIIIRNLKFTMTSITNTTDPAVYSPTGDEGLPQILTNGGDCIGIQGASSNIWIDHCEFYQEDPAIQPNKDLYDGLIDVKNASQYITISWCYFHDHYKCNLVGSSDSDNYDRKITFHHNYYRNIHARTPSYRFGTGHVYNSYFLDVPTTGVNSRMAACLRIESNCFENVDNPITSVDSSSVGNWDLHNSTTGADNSNMYVNCTGSMPTASNCAFTPPYVYSSFLDAVADVKTIVMANAGVGKINTGCGVQPTSSATASVSPQNTNTRTPTRTSSVPSSTVTPTRTRTVTPTFTRTNTAVPPTATFTRTSSPTLTLTSNLSPSFTATFTRTNTAVPPTASWTESSVPSPESSVTSTPTRTASSTRTVTPVTPTATFTNTNTAVPPTATFTRTNTAVPPTATVTVTGTNTIVPPTVTFTATCTWTNTPVPPTATRTSTLTPYPLSPTLTVTSTGSRVPGSTTTPTATQTPTIPETPNPSASATASVSPSRTYTITETRTPSVTPTPGSGPFTLDITVFPNPYNPAAGDLKFKFSATRQVGSISYSIYTAAYRRVLHETGIAPAAIISIPQRKLVRFASGTYYVIVRAETGQGGSAASQPQELIILKTNY